RMVDDAYFRIFHFELMAGRLYDSVDVESGRPVAVISDLLARRLYGSVEAAIGREFSMNYETYTVCGVVREPSFLMQQSFGQVFVPNTAYGYSPSDLDWLKGEAVGNLKLRVRVSDAEAGRKMTEAVGEVLRAYSAQRVMNEDRLLGSTLTLDVLPITSQSLGMPADFDWGEVFRRYGFMILILLIVPALNLSGMIAGNMETRLPEMGVRKSFGARRGRLFRSVLAENFRLTAIGGIIGLAVAALFVWVWRDWMFFLDDSIMANAPDSVSVIITSDMLFAPLVFIIAFLITFLLNFLAAMIPVWMSLRNPIVESLSESK
ncbi:MAG: FtsX-like permease family protein, partial [Muribaculaceae bacterium]|nr:FtsX-like permease family protein [Muribaculaceae bacterium]